MWNRRHLVVGSLAVTALVVVSCQRPTEVIEGVTPGSDFSTAAVLTSAEGRIHGPCPEGMVEVTGDYCPDVEETCLRWVDREGNTVKEPGPNESGRCGEFQYPTKCLSPHKVHMHFCIDEYESQDKKGERPKTWVSYYDAERDLAANGKRVCGSKEWSFACEGEDIKPYPYGYVRDKTACNFDNPPAKGLDVFKATRPGDETSQALDAMLVNSGELSRCVSSFGVHDQVGNADEWVVNETGLGHRSGLMGGHVFGVRSRCRAVTNGHGPTFSWYETSYRGCKDLPN